MNKEEFLAIALSALAWVGTMLAAFFTPILWAYGIAIVLVMADTITGVMAAGRATVKDISSKKAFSLVPKLIIYLTLVTVGGAAQYVDSQIPFLKLVLLGVGYIEVWSIDENFEKIFGFSFLKKILEAVKRISQFKRSEDENNNEFTPEK